MKYTITNTEKGKLELADHTLILTIGDVQLATATLEYTCEPSLIAEILKQMESHFKAFFIVGVDDFTIPLARGDFDMHPSYALSISLYEAFCNLGLTCEFKEETARLTPLYRMIYG